MDNQRNTIVEKFKNKFSKHRGDEPAEEENVSDDVENK